MWNIAAFVLVAVIQQATSLYSSGSGIIELTDKNWEQEIGRSDGVWLVEFYAPWCGHCQSLVPEYKKAASALSGVVKVAAVNADEERSLAARFKIKGFPTIKIFPNGGKGDPEDYSGARTADGIISAMISSITKRIKKQSPGGFKDDQKSSSSDAVIELTDSNFDKLVLGSDDIWLVEFFAPWCGHCKNLAPHWAKAAAELKGKVKLGALDATAHAAKAQEYGVQGYPTIKYFGPGSKDRSSAEDYQGGRTASDIVNFALEKLAENVPAPEINQILTEDDLKKACDQPLCIISVLPHILDCQADCRKSYIDILNAMGEKYKKKMWGWVWSEAGAQPDLETALEIGGFGYPAMAVLNAKKMKYSLLRGSFSKDGINEFLRDLSYGRGNTSPVKGATLPSVQKTEPWDGKDGVPPQDDDIDLSDVELDDLTKDEL